MYSAPTLARKYLHYWITASNGKGHGVHSPFVFEFIKFVLNDRTTYACYGPIEKLRQQLRKNKSYIDVADFGAGSAVIKSNRRRIDHIAASSLKPVKFARLLFRIVQFYKPGTIVELGTSFGITTAYLASGNTAARVCTLEGADAIAAIAKEQFRTLSLQHIELLEGDFAKTLPVVLNRPGTISLAFVDGNHRKWPTLDYFEQLLLKCNEQTVLIFDDIHWSKEMEEAWEAIRADNRVTLTIDLFFIGLVWVNPTFKVKQHFSIRF